MPRLTTGAFLLRSDVPIRQREALLALFIPERRTEEKVSNQPVERARLLIQSPSSCYKVPAEEVAAIAHLTMDYKEHFHKGSTT